MNDLYEGDVIPGEEGIDEDKTHELHHALMMTVRQRLPLNGVTMLSAAFATASEIGIMLGIQKDDYLRALADAYDGTLERLQQSMTKAEYEALLQKIAETRLYMGAASESAPEAQS